MTYYKFTQWDVMPIEELKNNPTYKALEEFDKGNKKPLQQRELVLDEPCIKVGGWCILLRPYLKRYWVKLKGYGINEYYAYNKTHIRKRFGSYVLEIIELKKDQ